MSGYGRGANVSQYIANLNSVQESAGQQEIGNIDDDLAYFTNAELFDFDLGGGNAERQAAAAAAAAAAYNEDVGQQKPNKNGRAGAVAPGMDFNGNFFFDGNQHQHLQLNTNFASTDNFDPQLFQSPVSATFPAQQQQAPQQEQQPQPAQQQQAPQQGGQVQQQKASVASPASQNAGSKRAHSVSSPAASVEDAARMAAEEDKRRRNTAASARFRVKKKQREAALEKTAKEMTDKVEQLQKRVSELEMENKWLRGLVVEKGMTVKKEDGESREDEVEADDSDERISDKQAKIGVGTIVADA